MESTEKAGQDRVSQEATKSQMVMESAEEISVSSRFDFREKS